MFLSVLWALLLLVLRGCGNNPWPGGLAGGNTFFTSFSAQIKSLDPATANYVHESAVMDNVLESPLGYDYLARPYRLVPVLLEEIPEPQYFGMDGEVLPEDAPAESVSRVEYLLRVRRGVRFQPHPCFASDARALAKEPLRPQDFGPLASRELTAWDFKVGFVRLCDPRLASSVFSTFKGFVAGMEETSRAVAEAVAAEDARRAAAGEGAAALEARPSVPDYRAVPCAGCEVVDDHTVRFTLTRKYPQFRYWLAMHYLAPVPQEALEFYHRADAAAAGLSFERWPVGTGAFLLEECEPNSRIVLSRNPNYREVRYPSEGSEEDRAAGRLADAGKTLPFLDRVVFNYERESIPNWLKFQQGYYDCSGIPNDMFDNAVAMNPDSGSLTLSGAMAARGLQLIRQVPPISYYFAFNMMDPVVGGLAPERCALRQALSMALDIDEYVTVFKNGNGVTAQGIIPPGVFGYELDREHYNRVLNAWDASAKRPRRRSLEEARSLMASAGYPGGIDPATGAPLVIHLDHAAAGLPDFKNRFQWLARRFALLGVTLEERASDLNRNRERIDRGDWQFLFERGWVADYPDPENFLFLFAGENGRVKSGGRGFNYTNYENPAFDAIFRRLETMPEGAERLALIRQAEELLDHDAPKCWGYHPVNVTLVHRWLHNYLPPTICYDNLKYLRIDAQERLAAQRAWNRPRRWPLLALAALGTAGWLAAAARKRGE